MNIIIHPDSWILFSYVFLYHACVSSPGALKFSFCSAPASVSEDAFLSFEILLSNSPVSISDLISNLPRYLSVPGGMTIRENDSGVQRGEREL